LNYLLDTNVVSEIRKGAQGHVQVMSWWKSTKASQVYLSVLTLGEIREGILRIKDKDSNRARHLGVWLTGLSRFFSSRLVPVDEAVAMRWADVRQHRSLPLIDSLMAASAISRDMTFVTRNTKDIEDCGVRYLNPFKA
jgi:toxin FitB